VTNDIGVLSRQCVCGIIVIRNDPSHFDNCLPFWENLQEGRENRLIRLLELKAPEQVVANERVLIAQAVEKVQELKDG
jgi:hypothetical protein